MPHEKKRSYHSALRARQASATRMRIISAAEKLFTSLGYTGTTITGIAAQANVAPQTVYAVFGSKKGIISAVVEHIHQSPRHKKMHGEALESTDPDTFLQSIAHLIADIYETWGNLFSSLRGGITAEQELAQFLLQQHMQDRDLMRQDLRHLQDIAPACRGRAFEQSLDIFWTLLSFDLYLSLVRLRGWSRAEYEAWLASLLRQQLLGPNPAQGL